jgi:hypothetical protein
MGWTNTMGRAFTYCVVLLLLLWSSGTLLAQTPPSEAAELLADVAEQARMDARDELEQQSVQDLDLLFGERAQQVNVERRELCVPTSPGSSRGYCFWWLFCEISSRRA